MQAPLAILGFALGVLAWYWTGRLGFITGALFMIANWPWTLLVMMKTNQKLMAMTLGDAGAPSRGLIAKWNGLHAVRTVLGGLAVTAFLMALSGM